MVFYVTNFLPMFHLLPDQIISLARSIAYELRNSGVRLNSDQGGLKECWRLFFLPFFSYVDT